MVKTLLLLALPAVAAATPVTLSHQGRLLDTTGSPITGTQVVQVEVTGPDGSWTTSQSVDFADGYYALSLGDDANPLDHTVLDDAALTLTVDGTVMDIGPLTTVPRAATAMSLAPGVVVDLGESSAVDGRTIVTLPELQAVAEMQLTSQDVAAACADPVYSRTCQDWAANNWPSERACITDGRWHLVYAHNGTGTPITVDGASFDYATAFDYIVNEGVDTKVRADAAAWNETHNLPCAAAGQYNGVLKCSSTNVALQCGLGTASCNELHSLIEVNSDGVLWAWESMDNDPFFDDSESGTGKLTSLQWWIRY